MLTRSRVLSSQPPPISPLKYENVGTVTLTGLRDLTTDNSTGWNETLGRTPVLWITKEERSIMNLFLTQWLGRITPARREIGATPTTITPRSITIALALHPVLALVLLLALAPLLVLDHLLMIVLLLALICLLTLVLHLALDRLPITAPVLLRPLVILVPLSRPKPFALESPLGRKKIAS